MAAQDKTESWLTYAGQVAHWGADYSPAIGMTADEVRHSTWGEPSSINKTTTKYSVSEQWVYKSPSKNRYIYIEDGLVTAIQE